MKNQLRAYLKNKPKKPEIHPEELPQKAYCYQGKRTEFMNKALTSGAFDRISNDPNEQFELGAGDLLIELEHGTYHKNDIPNNVKADPGAFIMLDSCNSSYENAVQVAFNSLKEGNTQSAKVLFFPDRVVESVQDRDEYISYSGTRTNTGNETEQGFDTPLHYVEIRNGQVYSGVFDSEKENTPLIHTSEQSRVVSFGKRTQQQHQQAITTVLSEVKQENIHQLNQNEPVEYDTKIEPLSAYLSKEQCKVLEANKRKQLTRKIAAGELSKVSLKAKTTATTTPTRSENSKRSALQRSRSRS